jgi:hypothetical protein
MKARFVLFLAACWSCALPVLVLAQPGTLPMPRVWNEDSCKKFSAADFERQLQQLKAERSALVAEWQALVKRSAEVTVRKDSEAHLETQLKDILRRLQQSRDGAETPPLRPPGELAIEKIMDNTSGSQGNLKKGDDAAAPRREGEPGSVIDVLAQAHTLFRVHHYEEALACFRLVDLKGKKAEARAPIQYLMAVCLLHLGKDEQALPLLRDVANSRGDEKLAGYAQWQLEMLRWQRDIQDRLGEQRGRRLALEKKI